MIKKAILFSSVFSLFWSVLPGAGALAEEVLFSSKPVLVLSAAKKIADACEAFAVENNLNLSIAIIDDSAQPILFRRMTGASLASVEIAKAKAETSVRFSAPTRALSEYVHGKEGKPGKSPGLAYVNGIVALTGGLPISTDRQLVGAIGVSGAASDQDEACAQAGLSVALERE